MPGGQSTPRSSVLRQVEIGLHAALDFVLDSMVLIVHDGLGIMARG